MHSKGNLYFSVTLYSLISFFSAAKTIELLSLQVKTNPYPHEQCHNTRRAGACVGMTQFWVRDQVLDWLKEDGNLGPKELKRKLKEHHKVDVSYRKVYIGKQLAM